MLKLPFEIKPCPRECENEYGINLDKCPPQLPPKFQQACKENPYLLRYLRMLPIDKICIPQYYEKVTKVLKGTKNSNLTYNVGGGLYVHILAKVYR